MHIVISTYSQLKYGISVEFGRKTNLIARKGNLEFHNLLMHSLLFFYNNTPNLCKKKTDNKKFYLHIFDMYDIYDHRKKTMRGVALMITYFTVDTETERSRALRKEQASPAKVIRSMS